MQLAIQTQHVPCPFGAPWLLEKQRAVGAKKRCQDIARSLEFGQFLGTIIHRQWYNVTDFGIKGAHHNAAVAVALFAL